MFSVILLFETFEFSIFAEWLECLLIEASDAFSSLFLKLSTENIFDLKKFIDFCEDKLRIMKT